jgi:uncharacterized RDD family membrane protein YckC
VEDQTSSLLRQSSSGTQPRSTHATSPTDELVELLAAYEESLDLAADLPFMLLLKRRRTRLGRLARVPRPRWLVRFFLVQHMRRTCAALKRRCYADRLRGRRVDYCDSDLVALEDFERTLPAALSTKVAAFMLALAVLFVAFLVADYAFPSWHVLGVPADCAKKQSTVACARNSGLGKISAQPLGLLTSATLTVDRKQAIDGFKSFACVQDAKTKKWKDCRATRVATSGLAALFLLPVTIWFLLLFIGVPPLRLKRLLFLVRPGSAEDVRQIYAAEPDVAPTSVYALEARAFDAFGARRPREVSLDLFAQAMLMIPLLLAGGFVLVFTAYGTVVSIQTYEEGDGAVIVGFCIFAALLLLVPVGRIAELRQTARQRGACHEPTHFERGVGWHRRAVAQLIDVLCICALATPFGVLVGMKVGQAELEQVLLWVGILPLASLLYHAAFLLARGSWRGQTLGRHALRLRVIRGDGTSPGRARSLVRDVLLKWLLFLPLLLPALVNILWPLWDYRRRAWHDIVVDTVIVRDERAPEPTAETALTGGLSTA